MFMKLIGISLTASIIVAGSINGKKQMKKLLELTEVVVTRYEVGVINRLIYMQSASEGQLLQKSQSGWQNFIRKNTTSKAAGRDPAKDIWRVKFFRVNMFTNRGAGKTKYEVRSAGLDKRFGTKDDIYSTGYY